MTPRGQDGAATGPRVLVIDDDDDVCEVLRQALGDEGYAVATVPQAKPPASVILLSALKDVEESAKRLGADGFVRKPFDLGEVVSQIERCLART